MQNNFRHTISPRSWFSYIVHMFSGVGVCIEFIRTAIFLRDIISYFVLHAVFVVRISGMSKFSNMSENWYRTGTGKEISILLLEIILFHG